MLVEMRGASRGHRTMATSPSIRVHTIVLFTHTHIDKRTFPNVVQRRESAIRRPQHRVRALPHEKSDSGKATEEKMKSVDLKNCD